MRHLFGQIYPLFKKKSLLRIFFYIFETIFVSILNKIFKKPENSFEQYLN